MYADAFVRPLDVLTLRGNRLFGEAGSWGDSLMPPPPSVMAGALRSHLLALDGEAGTDFDHPAVGRRNGPAHFVPGPFVLAACQPARSRGAGPVEPLFPLPADLSLQTLEGRTVARRLQPLPPPAGVGSSLPLPLWPVLAQAQAAKPPKGGHWLTAAGWQAWLSGRDVPADALVAQGELWTTEQRIGIGLNASTGTAEDSKLFTVQAITPLPDVGLAVRVQGAKLSPGVVRLGGDGRGARLEPGPIAWPEPDWAALARAGRARLVLTTPGLFEHGWLPQGCRTAGAADARDGIAFRAPDIQARVVCAAVARAVVVSGFDLAAARPKAAQRAVPAGAVYWLDDLQASADALRKLAEQGLWAEGSDHGVPTDPLSAQRRAEGFNRCTLATW